MSSLYSILGGLALSAIFFLLWRLELSRKKRVEDALGIASNQNGLLVSENDRLRKLIKKEIAKYEELIKHNQEVQDSVDAVDSAPDDDLLEFMQNRAGTRNHNSPDGDAS